MSSNDLLKEAGRVMTICNACRYCEGFCAVFPAMELRRTFRPEDLKYLANLCHNCRGCYYACQYAPPHEFDLNVPKALGQLRLETYRESAHPAFLAKLLDRNRSAIGWSLILGIVLSLLAALASGGFSALFSIHTGPGAFYRVISYPLMVGPPALLGLLVVAALAAGLLQFWSEIDGTVRELLDPRANFQAVKDALLLRYLDGGGHGCNYPDERFSMIRRWYHHLVFYGFVLCLAATKVAAIYDHILQWPAPYSFRSLPVLLGSLGGAALVTGTGGLLYLKRQMDREPAAPGSFGMDVGFLLQLFAVGLSGLLLLLFRETGIMGILLVAHLGLVLGLFLTLPCGKFVHAGYRYAALVRNALERAREQQ